MSDFGDSLRQQARWIREALDPKTRDEDRIKLQDIDTDELEAAAAELDRLETIERAARALIKDGLKLSMPPNGGPLLLGDADPMMPGAITVICPKCGNDYTVDHCGCPQCAISEYRAEIARLRRALADLQFRYDCQRDLCDTIHSNHKTQ